MTYPNNKPTSNTSNGGLQSSFRIVVLIICLLILGTVGYLYYQKMPKPNYTADIPAVSHTLKYDYLPTATGEIVYHTYYTLSYKEEDEQPEWVAYILTKKSIQLPNVKRAENFVPDPMVATYSATTDDYRGSGYTRGHLVPAGDMAFDETAMQETFYMSNMSPQLRQFNNGVWRELEENVRDWAYKADSLYVISGPILSNPIKKIGKKNKVTVPSAFYKVLLDNKGQEKKAIGFIIPHELSEKRLETYMVPITQIEALTGIRFFTHMSNQQNIEKMKSMIQPEKWSVNEKSYQLRITKWNYQ